jgi:hypothetical protein
VYDFLTFPPMIAFEAMTALVLVLHVGDEAVKRWRRR